MKHHHRLPPKHVCCPGNCSRINAIRNRINFKSLILAHCCILVTILVSSAISSVLASSYLHPLDIENEGLLHLSSASSGGVSHNELDSGVHESDVLVHHHNLHYKKSFALAPGVLPEHDDGYGYDYRREHSPRLSVIYSRYLKRPSYDENEIACNYAHEQEYLAHGKLGHSPLGLEDFEHAFLKAGVRIEEYEQINQEYLISDPRGLNFSAYVYVATLHAKYNELVTQSLKIKKCFDRKQVALHLPKLHIPPNPWKKKKYCELESPVSLTAHCDIHQPYSRLDGKCNNPVHTNMGSSFHCHRRLLPPDYSNGIHEVRLGVDQRPLPSPRLVTQLLMPDLDLNDPKLNAMHVQWGQLLVHDTFRTIQNLGLAIDCCRLLNPPSSKSPPMPFLRPNLESDLFSKNQPPMPHPECLPITNFPPNKATQMFQQICLNTVRSVACNTCSLGPRNQMNAATQVIDLSNIYGGNLLNNSELLRSYEGGQMLVQIARNGEATMPAAILPMDTDTLDLTPCNPPLKNPGQVGCFRTGDGMRGNQNPFIASLQSLLIRRHNMHASALTLVNPHWGDERLFQETRRIMIAEVSRIHYGEYLPVLLGDRLMKYFHLDVRAYGYTKYNPHVEPETIQAAGVAALRMGHSQVRSMYRSVPDKYSGKKGSFMLKDRFFNMIEVWRGQINALMRSMWNEPAKNVDPYAIIDLKDFLFFNPRRPSVVDLPSININRGRDHGVPAYVYYVQLCTGYEIKSWKDFERFMPISKVKGLRKVYRHYRDVDLFIAGLLEYHVKGAKLGPTFSCLIGIQFYHWKYGDRFYFEHGGEAGSFSPDQLNDIRSKSSLSNLLCKATSLEVVPLRPMEESSPHNPKISCSGMPEIEYSLWHESYKK